MSVPVKVDPLAVVEARRQILEKADERSKVSAPDLYPAFPDHVWTVMNSFASETTLQDLIPLPQDTHTYPSQYLYGRADIISALFEKAQDVWSFVFSLPGTRISIPRPGITHVLQYDPVTRAAMPGTIQKQDIVATGLSPNSKEVVQRMISLFHFLFWIVTVNGTN